MGLTELETIYWENLVSYGQAKTPMQRQYFLMRLSRTPLPQGIESSRLIREIRDEWDYYSSWYHAAIREMVLMPGFNPDPSAIATLLRGRITAEEAEGSLQLLKRLGFLVEDTEGTGGAKGRLKQGQTFVRYLARNDITNLNVRRFHRATAKLASDCLLDDSEEAHLERNFNGLTLAVNRKTLPLIKERLVAYLRELNTEFSIPQSSADRSDPTADAAAPTAGPADQVYHLNFQLVPLTVNPVKSAAKPAKKPEKERN